MIEIKTSHLSECSEEWIIQTLTYVLMMNMDRQVKKMDIVNMLTGAMWMWDLPPMPTLEVVMNGAISGKYRWHTIERTAMLTAIKKKREDFLEKRQQNKP